MLSSSMVLPLLARNFQGWDLQTHPVNLCRRCIELVSNRPELCKNSLVNRTRSKLCTSCFCFDVARREEEIWQIDLKVLFLRLLSYKKKGVGLSLGKVEVKKRTKEGGRKDFFLFPVSL